MNVLRENTTAIKTQSARINRVPLLAPVKQASLETELPVTVRNESRNILNLIFVTQRRYIICTWVASAYCDFMA